MVDNNISNRFYNDINKVIRIKKNIIESILDNNISIETFLSNDIDKFTRKVILGIVEKYISLSKNYVLNHITFKLSELDLEIIKNIPQGGNYRNVPLSTVKKSKRLTNLVKTGGRTTLYGRLDWNKPSYTITTLVNRPGNGTHVHPCLERVLSLREAARFQSFIDDYYFYGNKTQLLKQVGNAVPPFLAYCIGKSIIDKLECETSLDLFCGAGGLTLGFKKAGIKSILCNDIEESACITLKINNPELNVLCGDITDKRIKEELCDIAIANKVDIICGGPPCQGYSLAGLRSETDSRNKLFLDFVEIVAKVKPKVIVFENVMGILSYKKGQTYYEIHNLFDNLGYNTCGKVLNSVEFGIPQKRKRVIIICTRKDLNIEPINLYPKELTKNNFVNSFEAIGDLVDIPCDIGAHYDDLNNLSDYIKFTRGIYSFSEYYKLLNERE